MAKHLLGFSPPLAWAMLAQSTVCAVAPTSSWAAPEPVIQSGSEAPFNNINLLTNKGAYWYERYRFDLATEAFNRVLLIDPLNPSALRWQGLIELARGDADAANIWLKKLNSVHGQQHPQSIELRQVIELNTTKRQKFAELRYLASARPPIDLATQLSNLLEQAPQGEAAAQIYRVMAKTSDGRVLARQRLHTLAQQNPQDRRYTTLIKDLGLLAPEPAIVTVALPQTQKKTAQTLGYRPNKATTSRQQHARIQTASANATSEASSVTEAVIAPPNPPNISNFDQGKAWADQAQAALNDKEYTQAIELLQQAVNINPDYAWFRFDLANAWMDSGSEGAAPAAQDVMEQGLSVLNNSEMRFASALLATRQDRTQDALNLLAQTPRAEWSDSMVNLERRINLNQHLSALSTLEQKEAFNNMGKLLQATPEFNDEPRVKAYQDQLDQKKQIRVHAAYANATINGTPGVSHVDMREIPLQLDIPLDYENKLFLRMDRLQVRAGQVDLANTTNFAQLGTTTATDPAIQPSRLNQNYQGHLIGVGVETPKLRLDLGTTVGNFAVNDWVGGAQWKKTIGQSTLRLELSRRMIVGSALSTTGAIDPLTGQAWGAAKRNGVSGLLYSPLTPTLDFIGIAKANRITGKHLPSNNEYSLQGILSKTIYQNPVHRVELGGSLFLWSFSKNLRYYTYGQGGYYSPQAFASFSLPITWSGKVNTWAWRVQAKIGASESREDPAALYPLDPQLATVANTLGNSVENEGGPGGGTSRGLRVQLEHQVFSDLVLGGLLDIDRAEGYNPNRLQMYLRYTFGPNIEWNQPPEAIAPYSRF